MSTPRGLANHSLYLGRIILAAWDAELDRQALSPQLLAQAFAPACQRHLCDAYGWFLLALSSPAELPARVPQSVSELPAQAPGIALSGELRECGRLEQSGWISQLLGWQLPRPGRATTRSPGNLVQTLDDSSAEPAQFRAWADALDELFSRMSDSLDEY